MAEILVEDKQGVVWVTLNRPEVRNALSRDVNLQLQDIAVGFDSRDDRAWIIPFRQNDVLRP